jgi:hypothetical protein
VEFLLADRLKKLNRQLDQSETHVPDAIIDRVRADNSPAVLICSNASGFPVACNITTSRFAVAAAISAWDDLLIGADVEEWTKLLEGACLNHNACGGVFGFKRFDNAIRTFVLRAEPQFNDSGTLSCHLISGLDITDSLNQRHQSLTGEEFDLRGRAKSLHERLVSTATVLVSSADIIEGVVMAPDTDGLLKIASQKLSVASRDLVEQLQTLSLIGRSNRNNG